MWFRILSMKRYLDPASLSPLLAETDELVRIFHTSVSTARKNLSSASEPD